MAKRKKTKKIKGLSDKHRALVDAYFANDFNQTKAAEAVGYSQANHYISRLFSREDVQTEIAKRRSKLAQKFEVTQERVVEEYAKIAFANLSKFMVPQSDGSLAWDFTNATPEELASVSELAVDYYTEGRGDAAVTVKKFKIGRFDKKGALDSLARHLGMFNDKLNITGSLSLVERLQRGRERVKKAP